MQESAAPIGLWDSRNPVLMRTTDASSQPSGGACREEGIGPALALSPLGEKGGYTAAMTEVKQDSKMMTIRVPLELHSEARLLSVKRGESLNSLMVKWLTSWVERHREEMLPRG